MAARGVVPSHAFEGVVVPVARPKVLAIMDGGLRSRVEAGIEHVGALVSADVLPPTVRAVRERSVSAVLVSAKAEPESVRAVGRLVMKCAGMRAVAVVDDRNPPTPSELLYLGACGVSEVVSLSHPEGWNRLRTILTDAGDELPNRIHGFVDPALGDASPETRRFFELLVRGAPRMTTVRQFGRAISVHPGTLASRFLRARLPLPKCFLAATRIVYVRALLEAPAASIADVAYELRYSSPQSLARHVRQNLGISPGELRRRHSLAEVLALFVSNLIVPFRETWSRFDPLGDSFGYDRHAALPEHLIH
jgi:AraC-like DNA-binding protein